ncbi:ABC transporter ATP-binding protein [Desmospora profundinema]|uniref:Iron(III) transport system ATP-binding protein n=1 Tax=Desmospora profundinema TaxID=1571184 RepID=A0ABU1IKH8_9BACL|nr:ABC transporter ATP-binding protein [Desmospora profundinema]MDR6225289.1 iron(III) transport system ATP-binding protein [Desmospora profundinema]
MSVISFQAVTKTYPGQSKPAVQDLHFTVEEGEILTLLGPSGCGKTSTLRMIAGFEKPDTGCIRIGEKIIFDSDTWVPPENRGVGMVFQDYALFPHLTVEKNVAFGLQNMKRSERKERVKEVLSLVGLNDYQKRYPHQLSGGQQQRIALARALAPRPHVILLDEPFSNLDVHLKSQMRREIRQIIRQAGITAIFVTHDQKDALALSDHVAVIQDGRLLQLDTPQNVYQHPVNAFVAEFLGKTNLLRAEVAENCLCTEIGEVPCLMKQPMDDTEEVLLSVRPEVCRLDQNGCFVGKVKEVEYGGDYQEVVVVIRKNGSPDESTEMKIYIDPHQPVQPDQQIRFNIVPDRVTVIRNSSALPQEEKQLVAQS